MSFDTRAIHADGHNKPMNAHAWPIFQTSTFLFDSPDHGAALFAGKEKGHIYSRIGNPTVEAMETIMNNLEGGAGCSAFSSGMGAVNGATLAFLKAGDTLIMADTLYGCTVSLFTHFFPRWNINVVVVDTSNLVEVEAALRANPTTKVVYVESPANPTNKVTDLTAVAHLAHSICPGSLLSVDATFSSPYFLKPLSLGADVVLHSVTKYINGHGDVVGGVVTVKTPALHDQVRMFRKDAGSIMSPLDAFLVMRGLRTLGLRMRQLEQNGLAVARYLQKHPAVGQVLHPGLPEFPGHEIAARQQTGFGSTFAFTMRGGYEVAKTLLENVHMCSLAVSLGGVDTLIEHPASMTHAAVPDELMRKQGLTRDLVRISVGLEDPQEIIADLRQAIAVAEAKLGAPKN